MRKIFFAQAPANAPAKHIPTLLNVPVLSESGDSIVELRDIDVEDDPLKQLSYSDFVITTLLKSNVKLRPIPISEGSRLGVTDAMIEDFNNRLEAISDQLFNPIENK